MKFIFLGSGAMGSAIGGILAESGQDVLLIDRWKDHVEVLNARGLLLKEKSGSRVIKEKATSDLRAVGEADLIVLLVKSYHTSKPFASRVVGRTHLEGLQQSDMKAYLLHHLRIADGKEELFAEEAITAEHVHLASTEIL